MFSGHKSINEFLAVLPEQTLLNATEGRMRKTDEEGTLCLYKVRAWPIAVYFTKKKI